MKFQINAAGLSAILKQCSRVAGKRANDATSHVLLEVRAGELAVTAQNGSQQIVRKTRTSTLVIEQEGAICASAHKLDQIAAALPGDKHVKVALTEEKLVLTCGRSRFSLATQNVDSFPLITVKEPVAEFSIASELLVEAGRSVAFCCGRDDVRPYLNGMLLNVQDGKADLVGSDGHRMGVRTLQGVDGPAAKVIIPTPIVEDLLSFSTESQTSIRLYPNLISVVSPNGEFYSKLIDGTYPDFGKLIQPHSCPTVLTVNRADLLAAVQRVSLVADDKTAGVSLALKHGEVTIRALSNNNDGEESLPAGLDGDSMEVGFNARYLSEILKAIPTETVAFQFLGLQGPVHVAGDPQQTKYVLMPMRI